jgi:CHAT domain-containing protein
VLLTRKNAAAADECANCLREGPYGSMWAAHLDESGSVTGWEERGPDWRGFSTGGTKTLFQLGSTDAMRFISLAPSQSRGGLSHPYYWAPFLLTGNWR